MADRLAKYKSKRDFSKTSEPPGDINESAGGVFVVQRHAARRLHYDLRLEYEGAMLSWAVPEGPSLSTKERRLAVRTEDHPISYNDFEGTIPPGEYGGGIVMIWDRGRFRWKSDPVEGLREGSLKVELFGERLKGGFALVKMKPREKERQENWLLIKEKDLHATGAEPTKAHLTSVVTGRTAEEIGAGLQAPRRGEPRPPPFVAPALARAAEAAPEGPDWWHEIKYDGYRLLAASDRGTARLYVRSGADWTETLPLIAKAVADLGLGETLLDGELIAPDERGRTDFGALQAAIKGAPQRLNYVVFDLLIAQGEDVRSWPLRKRKQRLAEVLAAAPKGGVIQLSPHLAGDGPAALNLFCREGLEGIIAKRADAPYSSGRGPDWLKIKCDNREEFIIGGYLPSEKRQFRSLIIGQWAEDKLHYCGKIGSGFDDATMPELLEKLQKLQRNTNPFANAPRDIVREAIWVEPKLVAQTRYSERTKDGVLRHPVFQGLREDKPASQIINKQKTPDALAAIPIRLTHPEKILFEGAEITKLDLALYYQGVAAAMGRFAFGRPLSIVRCPEGRAKACFFQKHAMKGMPKEIGLTPVPESDGETQDYLYLDNRDGLIACAQIAAIEIHLWGAKAKSLERPDRLVIDLDPDPNIPFASVKEAAFAVRDLMDYAGLRTFALVTGGKGVHIVAPLAARQTWQIIGDFAAGLSAKLAKLAPDRFTANMAKAKRVGKIYVDHLRNKRGATAISPFSPRAKPGAPVAAPVTWSELAELDRADAFGLQEVLARVRTGADPWADYEAAAQSLTKAATRKLGLD